MFVNGGSIGNYMDVLVANTRGQVFPTYLWNLNYKAENLYAVAANFQTVSSCVKKRPKYPGPRSNEIFGSQFYSIFNKWGLGIYINPTYKLCTDINYWSLKYQSESNHIYVTFYFDMPSETSRVSFYR